MVTVGAAPQQSPAVGMVITEVSEHRFGAVEHRKEVIVFSLKCSHTIGGGKQFSELKHPSNG